MVFNQIKNAAGNQFAGSGVPVTTDATGSESINFGPFFFGGGTFTVGETVAWNYQAASVTDALLSFSETLATLSSKVYTQANIIFLQPK